jgi:signal transduction histidine kinase
MTQPAMPTVSRSIPAVPFLTSDEVLAGGGEMGALMRAYDWASSPVGPVSGWPQSLRTAVSILLDSRYPTLVCWGPQYIQFYNDAYRPVLGATKHPHALGQGTPECFPEVWHFIGPLFDRVMAGGEPTYLDDQLFLLDRNGYLEETYFTFCYSAIRNESGRPGGVFVTCVETTSRVIGERRLRTLRELAARGADAKTAEDACRRAMEALSTDTIGIPFALLYLFDDERRQARLVGATPGLDLGREYSPLVVQLDDGDSQRWPFVRASRATDLLVIDDLRTRFSPLPGGPWEESPAAAALIHVGRGAGAQDAPSGLLIVGLNSRRAFDDDYRGFLSLVASQIGSSIGNARAYEEERRRAESLAELDRAKTTFFSNVSHEFRTPLTLMLGPIEDLLRRDTDATEQREKLQLLHRNALRLLKLVNTLLDFSRIEAGRVEAVYEPVDVAQLTAELAATFRAAVESAGLRLVVDCPPLEELAYVDRDMWEKIVLNLLSNALKFTFEGEIGVAVVRDGDHVRLTVSDTGTGIPAEQLPHIFERFRRIEGARSRTHEGSGIGLSLVQELVRLHGGRLVVESAVDAGTTFIITIPLGAAHLPRERIGARRSTRSTAIGALPFVEEAMRWLPPSGNGAGDIASPIQRPLSVTSHAPPRHSSERARVLVVDDNSDMLQYVSELLAESYDVELATDGVAALEQIERALPDLVVTDVMMPRMDGLALVRALRREPRTRALPVVLLSARAGEEDTIEGMETGADDYLVKPFSARELRARVKTHVELSRRRRQSMDELEAARERLDALFQRAPAVSAVLRGPEHVFEMANPAYRELVGNRELLGRSVREVFPDAEGQGYFELLDHVYRTGEPYVGNEARLLLDRGDGVFNEWFLNFVYQPLRDGSGQITGIFVHGVDVTTQVRARREIEELYGRVQAANRSKSEFLAAMSHELRTPLNAIIGYIDLLSLGVRGAITPAQLADLERIRAAGQYLLSLINDLLNFTRLEAGRVEFRPCDTSLEDVTASALELVQAQLAQKGLRLERGRSRPDVTAYVDGERVQQMLINLLTNAIKYTESGGTITVWVDDGATADGAPAARIHVRDTGIGIPAEQLTHIFEPFVQVQRHPRAGSQLGVGLGLSITRDLAHAMGGDILVTSELGRGSTFTIALPRTAPTR